MERCTVIKIQHTGLILLLGLGLFGLYIVSKMPRDIYFSSGRGFDDFMRVPLNKAIKGPVGMPHDHPYLIQHIRKSLSPITKKKYNLKQPKILDQSQCKQPEMIINILGEKKRGFFVESGGYDGEAYSNTLMFERKYGWQGILVEPDPDLYANLLKKNRKARSINACLSSQPYPTMASFSPADGLGKIIEKPNKTLEGFIEVMCLPLYSILIALNSTYIDFFSLDVEGNELDVLMTIPWEKVTIQTLSVEFTHIPQGKDALLQYMSSVGYILYGISLYEGKEPLDYIFHRHDVVPIKKSIIVA